MPGAGIAQVCRACGAPASCGICGGALRSEEGSVRCVVCRAEGRCAACGAADFGVRPGGAERVEGWARRLASVPVLRLDEHDRGFPPGEAVAVGGPESVRDVGPLGLDLVGILDVDAAARRAGVNALERALCTWAEAVGWARPSGRAIVQTERPNDPAVQALVAGRPDRFHRAEVTRRADAGFPVGATVFRVVGDAIVPRELERLSPITLLVSGVDERTVCLVALDPGRVAEFGAIARSLAARDAIERVEAEPHL
jgi:primosomal protein N'